MNLAYFIQNINLEVQTRGFGENFDGNNLHLDITFIGRISDQISPRYRINTNPLITSLGSNGIQFLPPQVFESRRNPGIEWQTHLNSGSSRTAITAPQTSIMTNWRNSLSIRFADYENIQTPDQEEVVEEEEQPSRRSFMNLWIGESYIHESWKTKQAPPESQLSPKLLAAVEKWEKQKQEQTFDKVSFQNYEK
uniref:Polyprotein P3 n=1 Tax=Cajanus cajan TaxID=3821 RepID=A0A151RDD6_CAJCA|nr:Polyprotein P3 [Cajanus cajan]